MCLEIVSFFFVASALVLWFSVDSSLMCEEDAALSASFAGCAGCTVSSCG